MHNRKMIVLIALLALAGSARAQDKQESPTIHADHIEITGGATTLVIDKDNQLITVGTITGDGNFIAAESATKEDLAFALAVALKDSKSKDDRQIDSEHAFLCGQLYESIVLLKITNHDLKLGSRGLLMAYDNYSKNDCAGVVALLGRKKP